VVLLITVMFTLLASNAFLSKFHDFLFFSLHWSLNVCAFLFFQKAHFVVGVRLPSSTKTELKDTNAPASTPDPTLPLLILVSICKALPLIISELTLPLLCFFNSHLLRHL